MNRPSDDDRRSVLNPLKLRDNYSATSNNVKLVHWPLMGGLLHLVQRGGPGRGRSPPRPLLVVPNVTAHPSAASVPITVLLYNGPLPCGFNVPVKGTVLQWTACDMSAPIRSDRNDDDDDVRTVRIGKWYVVRVRM